MNKKKTYKIVAKTNGWIASRDPMFHFNGHKTEVTLERGLLLKEAKTKLLELFNNKFEWEIGYSPNWGIAVIKTKNLCFGANCTYKDGTRSFNWDSRTFSIELEEDEN